MIHTVNTDPTRWIRTAPLQPLPVRRGWVAWLNRMFGGTR